MSLPILHWLVLLTLTTLFSCVSAQGQFGTYLNGMGPISSTDSDMICMVGAQSIPEENWYNAQDALDMANHLHLASIHSAYENQMVYGLIDYVYNATGETKPPYVWLGLHDGVAEDTVFEWANGEPVDYTNWAAGNPTTGNGFSAAAMSTATGQWVDIPADSRYPYAFRVPPSSFMYHSLFYANLNRQQNCFIFPTDA